MKMVTGDNDYDVGGNHAGDDSGGNQQVDVKDDEDAWEEQCDGKHCRWFLWSTGGRL